MGSARDALLEKAIDHVARHGLSDASQRDLAAAIGTSHRMLNYHFGGRDGLVAAIVEAIEAQQREALDLLAREATTPRDLVERQWAQLTDPALRPFVVLFFEVLALALHDRPGTEPFLAGLTEPWLDLGQRIAADLDLPADRDDLRLGVAVTRGLLIEVLATGDLAGPTASLQRYLAMWEAATAG